MAPLPVFFGLQLGAEHLCRLFGLLQQARQKVSGAGILEAEGAGFTVGPELYK